MSPTLKQAPSADEIRAITCPFQRAAAITSIARRCGTLSTELWKTRRDALAEIREIRDTDGRPRYSIRAIAARVGLSHARISQIAPLREAAC